jgi:GrpB-like predicted nucleotidyltransferase (UPF0157 family)
MDDWSAHTTLGLTYGTVRLAPSNPQWPEAFQRLAAELRAALGEAAAAVEHVGSTAVPGLAAKPILDVVIGLAPDTDPDRVIATLERLGYQYRGDKGEEGGLLLVLEDRPAHRVAHLHLVGHGDALWRRYLTLRDRLRSDPAAKAAYAGLKDHLAARYSEDRRAYTAAKAAFIARLLAEDDPPHGSSRRAEAAARPSISGGTTPSSRSNPTRAGAATTTVTSGPPRPAATDTDSSRTPATPESPADPAR